MVTSGQFNLNKALQYVMDLVNEVPAAVKDCGLGNLSFEYTADSCEDALDKTTVDVRTLVTDLKNDDVEAVLTDATALYQDLGNLENMCKSETPEQLYDAVVGALLNDIPLPSGADKAKC